MVSEIVSHRYCIEGLAVSAKLITFYSCHAIAVMWLVLVPRTAAICRCH